LRGLRRRLGSLAWRSPCARIAPLTTPHTPPPRPRDDRKVDQAGSRPPHGHARHGAEGSIRRCLRAVQSPPPPDTHVACFLPAALHLHTVANAQLGASFGMLCGRALLFSTPRERASPPHMPRHLCAAGDQHSSPHCAAVGPHAAARAHAPMPSAPPISQ